MRNDPPGCDRGKARPTIQNGPFVEAKRIPQGRLVEERTVALMAIIVTVQMKEAASTVYNKQNLFSLWSIQNVVRNGKLWNEHGVYVSEAKNMRLPITPTDPGKLRLLSAFRGRWLCSAGK